VSTGFLTEVFVVLLKGYADIEPQIKLRRLSYVFCPNCYALIIAPFDSISPELLIGSINKLQMKKERLGRWQNQSGSAGEKENHWSHRESNSGPLARSPLTILAELFKL
jgi:hypothetical protein